jgi:hypothetical protein
VVSFGRPIWTIPRGLDTVAQLGRPDSCPCSHVKYILCAPRKLRVGKVSIEDELEDMVLQVEAVLLGLVIGEQALTVPVIPMAMLIVVLKHRAVEREDTTMYYQWVRWRWGGND